MPHLSIIHDMQPWEKRPRSDSLASYSVKVGSNDDGEDDADVQIAELKIRLQAAKERITSAGTRRGVLTCKRRELSTLRDELVSSVYIEVI